MGIRQVLTICNEHASGFLATLVHGLTSIIYTFSNYSETVLKATIEKPPQNICWIVTALTVHATEICSPRKLTTK